MFILIDVEGHPVQMVSQTAPGAFDAPILFHPLARLCSKQRKYQPTLLMTEDTWDYIRDPDVTHEGAFGSDFCIISQAQMSDRFIDATFELGSVRWVVVWKFPGDLNHLATEAGTPAFRKILDVPLPVGEYPLYDDGWSGFHLASHPSFPQNAMVEKVRTDVPTGKSVHYLEDRHGVKVAMIGSHYFIRELWKVKSEEKKRVVALLKQLRAEVGIDCFPCYGQHHAIVFYIDRRPSFEGTLITPRHLATLLQTTALLRVLQNHSYYDLKGWSNNVVRLAPKATFASASSTPAPPLPAAVTKRHRQPHPTGSLLRKRPRVDSGFVSDHPVPNNATVQVVEAEGEFVLIRYGTLEGWVRAKYLD